MQMYESLWLTLENLDEVSKKTGITKESLLEQYFKTDKESYVMFMVYTPDFLQYVRENATKIMDDLNLTVEDLTDLLERNLQDTSRKHKESLLNNFSNTTYGESAVKLPKLLEGVEFPDRAVEIPTYERRDILKALKNSRS